MTDVFGSIGNMLNAVTNNSFIGKLSVTAGAFATANPNTQINDDLVFDLTRFFPMDFMSIVNEFHNKFEQ